MQTQFLSFQELKHVEILITRTTAPKDQRQNDHITILANPNPKPWSMTLISNPSKLWSWPIHHNTCKNPRSKVRQFEKLEQKQADWKTWPNLLPSSPMQLIKKRSEWSWPWWHLPMRAARPLANVLQMSDLNRVWSCHSCAVVLGLLQLGMHDQGDVTYKGLSTILKMTNRDLCVIFKYWHLWNF